MSASMLGRLVCMLAVTLGSIDCAAPQPSDRAAEARQGQPAPGGRRFELRLTQTTATPGWSPGAVDGEPLFVAGEPLVTMDDVMDAEAIKNEDATSFQIRLDLKSSAGDRLAAATKDHTGRPVAILIDGRVASAPKLSGPLQSAIGISGSFDEQEVTALVNEFRAAAKRNRSKEPLLCRVLAWC